MRKILFFLIGVSILVVCLCVIKVSRENVNTIKNRDKVLESILQIESPSNDEVYTGVLPIKGYALDQEGIDSITITLNYYGINTLYKKLDVSSELNRLDVWQNFYQYSNAQKSGFYSSLDINEIDDGLYKILVVFYGKTGNSESKSLYAYVWDNNVIVKENVENIIMQEENFTSTIKLKEPMVGSLSIKKGIYKEECKIYKDKFCINGYINDRIGIKKADLYISEDNDNRSIVKEVCIEESNESSNEVTEKDFNMSFNTSDFKEGNYIVDIVSKGNNNSVNIRRLYMYVWSNYIVFQNKKTDIKNSVLSYQTLIDGIGWTPFVTQGQVSGITIEDMKITGIRIKFLKKVKNTHLEYMIREEGKEWSSEWIKDGVILYLNNIQGIKIRLVDDKGEVSKKYNVHYAIFDKETGWQGYVENGEVLDTEDYIGGIKAIKIQFSKK